MACVTIAPSGLSASFATSFPIRRSHTPTQFLVPVTAKLKLSDKLKKKFLMIENNVLRNVLCVPYRIDL